MFTTVNINFSDAQGQITLELAVVSGRNLNSSKLTCKNENDRFKNEGARVFTISPIISFWYFFRRTRAANSTVLGPI